MEKWPRTLRLALALVCMLLAAIGIVLPVFPGWPFFLVGLVLLTSLSKPLRRAWHRYLRRHPKVRSALRRRRERA